jgi:hypothetical protein
MAPVMDRAARIPETWAIGLLVYEAVASFEMYLPIVMMLTALLISDGGPMADTTATPALWKQPTPTPTRTV